MPLYLRGSNLHAHHPNQYRLENAAGRVLLTHNNISTHPAYRNLLNPRKLNNKNEVRNLGKYIANRIYGEGNMVNTRHKITNMVEKILNHRKGKSKPYESNYLAALETFQSRAVPLRANREPHFKHANKLQEFVKKGGTLTNAQKVELRNALRMNRYYSNLLNAEEKMFEKAVKKWVDHQHQIKYWQWVKNKVVPEVKRLLLE